MNASKMIVGFALSLSAVGLVHCGGAAEQDAASTDEALRRDSGAVDAAHADAAPTVVNVSMSTMAFSPKSITIARGSTVVWTNTSPVTHTVTSGKSSKPADHAGALFDQSVAPGQTFRFTFTTPGTQPYFCRPHEALGMKATVIVQ